MEQWYRGVILNLLSSLNLVGTIQLKQRWEEWRDLPMLQRLSLLLDEILKVHLPHDRLVIFIDEVDSALCLDFPVDDFFAFVRSCYNYRTSDPSYDRLTWALFGVTTPASLIQDKTRTPFNIGRQIHLKGFQIQESLPLAAGLSGLVNHPLLAVEAILDWTKGQPLLTQKLCRLLIEPNNEQDFTSIRDCIDDLVHTHILTNWQTQDQPEHLRTIRDRLVRNEQSASRLLAIYQTILQRGGVAVDNSPEQAELLLSGIVHLHNEQLQVHNPIYQIVFDQAWVDRELANLRPYSQALNDWLISDRTDESKLLRGKSLSQAQAWIQGKRLSDDDYQFIAASQAYDQAEIQTALEAERLQAVEAQLLQEQRSNRLQRILLVVGMITIVLTSLFGGIAYWNYDRAIASEFQTRVSEIKTLIASANARASANYEFEALLEAMRATIHTKQISHLPATDQIAVDDTLRQSLLNVREVNQMTHQSTVHTLHFSPNGELIAAAGADGILKIWRSKGELVANIAAHQGTINVVRFSRDGQMIATGSEDATVKLWRSDGSLIRTVKGFQGGVWRLEFADNGVQFATVSMDRFVRAWTTEGELVEAFGGRGEDKVEGNVVVSPDHTMAAIGTRNHTIQLWRRSNGLPFSRLKGHQAMVWGLKFSPDSQYLVSGSDDGVVNLWNRQGKHIRTLGRLEGRAGVVTFSPDGQLIAAAGSGKRIWVWQRNGDLVGRFNTADTDVWDLAFSPDSRLLASGGGDRHIHLWQLQHPFTQTLYHDGTIEEVDVTVDGQMIMSTSNDDTVKLWNRQGQPLKIIKDSQRTFYSGTLDPQGHYLVTSTMAGFIEFRDLRGTVIYRIKAGLGAIMDTKFSPDGNLIVTGSQDRSISLWQRDGKLIKRIEAAHGSIINHLAFSPDSQMFVSGSSDQTAKLWDRDGNLLQVLRGHTASVMHAAFSPDGQTIATASGDQTIRLWSLDGTLRQTILAHDAGVWGVTFSPDGQIIASGGVDNQIKLWTIAGKLLTTLTGHTSGIRDLKFTPDGQTLISGGLDQTVRLWNVDRILQDDLFQSSCAWIKDYLKMHRGDDRELQQACFGKITSSDSTNTQ